MVFYQVKLPWTKKDWARSPPPVASLYPTSIGVTPPNKCETLAISIRLGARPSEPATVRVWSAFAFSVVPGPITTPTRPPYVAS